MASLIKNNAYCNLRLFHALLYQRTSLSPLNCQRADVGKKFR